MERKKTNYFKEIFSGMDAFLAVFIGALLCVFMFCVDHYNVLGRLTSSVRWTNLVGAAYSGIILMSVIVILLVCIPVLFKKYITRRDFLLIMIDSLSLTNLLVAILRGKNVPDEVAFWAVILGIGALFTILRFVKVSEPSDEKLLSKDYFGAIARKYDIRLLILIGVVVGIGAGVLMQNVSINALIGSILPVWKNMDNYTRIGVLGSVFGVFAFAVILATLCGSKKSKVNIFDAILFTLGIASLFSVVKVAMQYPRISTSFFAIWFIATVSLAVLIVIRSLFTNPGERIISKEKTSKNYFGGLLEHYSPIFIVMVGLALAAGLIYIDIVGLRHLFDTGLRGVIVVVTIIAYLAAFALGIVCLTKGNLVKKKINFLDWLLNVAAVAGLVIIVDLFLDYTVIKLVLFTVAFVAILFFIEVRIRRLPMQAELVVETTENNVVNEENKVEENTIVEEENKEENTVVEEEKVEEVKEEVDDEVVEEEKVNEVEEDVDDSTETIVDAEGKVLVVRYKKSFKAKLSLSSDEVQGYYNDVKNYILGYKRVNSRVSWNYESFNKGRTKCAKLNIRGKTLVMYLALDPKDYENSKYNFRIVGESRKYAVVPMMIKIKSNRGVKYAKELIDDLMTKLGVARKELPYVDYREEKHTFDELMEMQLIKEIKVDGSNSFLTKNDEEEKIEDVTEVTSNEEIK